MVIGRTVTLNLSFGVDVEQAMCTLLPEVGEVDCESSHRDLCGRVIIVTFIIHLV